jgi:mono/diheme cytochrome c family protein
MKLLRIGLVCVSVIVLAVGVFAYSGLFNVAADTPHWAFVSRVIEIARDRSISVRATAIEAPVLNDPKLLAEGGQHYAAMCVDCHLAPGAKQSEMREGLYPQPPDLTKHVNASPAEMFWVIKHGIKMSAMPAWGKTHDDRSIWGLVAFVQKLPELTRDQYQALVGTGDDVHDLRTQRPRGAHPHHHHEHDTGSPR